MKKLKLKLEELHVSSFITVADTAAIKGGVNSLPVNCPLSLDCITSMPLGVCLIVASKNSSCP